MTITDYLRRGLAAGLLAGLLAGLFAWAAGEPAVRDAIELEEQASEQEAAHDHDAGSEQEAGAHGHDEGELVSRPVQEAMLPVATGLVGAAFGGVFGLGYGLARRRMETADEWAASWKAGAAVYGTVVLFPALAYPANPPAVGDPGTIANRTGLFTLSLGIGLAALLVLWAVARFLRSQHWSREARQVAVGLAAVVVLGGAWFALPAPESAGDFPVDVMWNFRLSSMGTQLILWTALTAVFAWLNLRASHKAAAGTEKKAEAAA
ncbi:CbtA family protein [Salininema proteolyticum]|uniref:CbtA family protein n=1 Tax=Salininema proteolyticum TaxID=1607685 RepID=A0ABV8U5L8_9ACTN